MVIDPAQYTSASASAHICWPACLKRVHIYASQHAFSEHAYMSASMLKASTYMLAGMHEVKNIYGGPHVLSTHNISGPIHNMQLKNISWLRWASTFNAHWLHIWKYACSIKIWLKGLGTHQALTLFPVIVIFPRISCYTLTPILCSQIMYTPHCNVRSHIPIFPD